MGFLKMVWLVIILLMHPSYGMEVEAVVIEVRKKVKLHKTEKVYPDYFINGGTKVGLSEGTIVSVVRRVPVHDPFLNSSIGDFRIKVAEVEIIHVDSEKSIARLVTVDRNKDRPMVKYDAVMVGDRLDLNSVRQKTVARMPVGPFPITPSALMQTLGEDPNRVPTAVSEPAVAKKPLKGLEVSKAKPAPVQPSAESQKTEIPMENLPPKLTTPMLK